MSLLLLAILTQSGESDKALDRYRDFMKENPSFEASFTVKRASGPVAQGRLLIEKGKSLRLDGKWRDSDYSFVTTKGGLLRELERSRMVYDEVETDAPFALPSSKISPTPGFISPFFLAAADLRQAFGEKAKITDLGPGEIEGRKVHSVRFEVETQMGPEFGEFSIDPNGMVVQALRYGGSVEQRGNAQTWNFQPIKPIKSIPPQLLQLQIPNGYVPFRLPSIYGPLQIGEPFPFDGWSGGKKLVKGKQTLYALLGEDCAPSEASLPALEDLRKAGLPVVLLSDAGNRQAAKGRYFDPTGKSLEALTAPATPTFFLVGPDGKVQRLWMGFDPAKRKPFVREIQEALKEDATK